MLTFAGPEKLLEVWFSASESGIPACAAPLGLKAVPAEVWKEMLDLVHCQVLSIVESEAMDAYLLSESSMFVFPHKLILKTCGTTTLLCGLPRILEIAANCGGFPHTKGNLLAGIPTAATPYRVFYSRKNFLFPDQQKGPHRSWRDEVKALDRLFLSGSAYMIGKMNGEHWYLYLTEPNTILTPPSTPDRTETATRVLNLPTATEIIPCETSTDVEAQDETLEILMTDLDEQNARQFYLDHASAVAEGRYYQRAHRARGEARQSLGTIPENDINGIENQTLDQRQQTDNDAFDIFSQTSSDHKALNELTPDEEREPYPVELTTEGHALGTVVSETCGLSEVYSQSQYPDARIDAYLFTPCGFSANGVIPAASASARTGGHYFTVHVTPEPQCSYASFETNVPCWQSGRETADLVKQVVAIFKPGRFSVTLFETKAEAETSATSAAAAAASTAAEVAKAEGLATTESESKKSPTVKQRTTGSMDSIPGYRRVDRIVHDLDGYELVFRYYERWDWQGGAPRLGEVY